jgi:hypothetical protein
MTTSGQVLLETDGIGKCPNDAVHALEFSESGTETLSEYRRRTVGQKRRVRAGDVSGGGRSLWNEPGLSGEELGAFLGRCLRSERPMVDVVCRCPSCGSCSQKIHSSTSLRQSEWS